jgi:hypothetical protein
MKRLMLFAAGLTFLLFAWAFAADQPVSTAPAAVPSQTAKITRMRAPGTVLEISDVVLKIERKIKDRVETMEFVLEKPVKFKVGDRVRVSYVEKDGKMIATRVVNVKPVILQSKKTAKPIKEAKPAGGNTVPASVEPAAK